MIDRELLLDAIDECEVEPLTSSNIQRLANLYTIYNHHYSQPTRNQKTEKVIVTSGTSDFLKSVDGKSADDVLNIIDELVETIQIIQPALYYGLIKRIQEL